MLCSAAHDTAPSYQALLGTSGKPCQEVAGFSPETRCRNVAICARFTTSSGANRFEPPIPVVMPSAFAHRTACSYHDPAETSTKPCAVDAGGEPIIRQRNVTICA